MNVFDIKYSLQHGAEVFSEQICFAQMILESGGMYSTFYLGAIINHITSPFFSLVAWNDDSGEIFHMLDTNRLVPSVSPSANSRSSV